MNEENLWLTDDEAQQQEKMERLENLEKCIERIKDNVSTIINQPIEKIEREKLESIIEEIEWEIRCLE